MSHDSLMFRAMLIGAFVAGTSSLAQVAHPSAAQPPPPAPAAPTVPERAFVGARTPDSLAKLVMTRFVSGTALAFDSVFPDPLGRAVVETALQHKNRRSVGLSRVLWSDASRAVLLLTGIVHSGEGSGIETGSDETNGVRRFSGLYEAVRGADSWMISRQIPLDTLNYIRGQTLHVALSPGKRSDITDTLAVTIGSPYGLAVRFNTAARLASVRLDGRPARYAFGGGVLWIEAPKPDASRRSQLVLRYAIADQHTPPPARAHAAAKTAAHAARSDSVVAYGALNNTDVWHPFFSYDSGNDFGPMSVTATIPAVYRLTTSVPQTETVHNGIRTVHGESMHNQFLLALHLRPCLETGDDADRRPAIRDVPHAGIPLLLRHARARSPAASITYSFPGSASLSCLPTISPSWRIGRSDTKASPCG